MCQALSWGLYSPVRLHCNSMGEVFYTHFMDVESEAWKMVWSVQHHTVGKCLASAPVLHSVIGDLIKKA